MSEATMSQPIPPSVAPATDTLADPKIGSLSSADIRFWPLLVRLRKKSIQRGLWEVDSWSLEGCDSDRASEQRQALGFEQIPLDDTSTDYQWSGLSLELFRDERAAYRFNLTATDPRLFVICNEEDELMQPYLVTASQDEASSYMDGGEEDVYSIPMPEAVQCWIEGFIARHGEPELEAGKSKRRHHGKRKKSEQGVSLQSGKSAGGERV
ncbi:MAG: DUF3305 domain-containing protein [Halopseudomonas sp.]